MHIPDNYLSPSTCAVMAAVMVPAWTVSIRKVKQELPKEKLPQLGIGAAFSFLMMMFNVPVPGGTTAHAVGGTLIAILLGPYAACISISTALLLQALLFGDGGILAFGANCFNMAFVLPFTGYFIYRLIKEHVKTQRGEYLGAVLGSYCGINLAALCAAVEFGIQPLLFTNAAGQPLYCPYPLGISVPAMLIPHLTFAGLAEVLFTVFIYSYIRKVSPGMVYENGQRRMKPIFGLIAVLICLSPLGLLATGTAWGEWGSDEIASVVSGGKALGYVPAALKSGFNFSALLSDYSVHGLPEVAGYLISAVVGVALLVIIFKIASSFARDKAQAF